MNRSFRLRALVATVGWIALSACSDGTGSGKQVPARMDIVTGDLQTAPVGTELAQPLVVKVVDDKGKAVSGQLVNFHVTAGGGSVFAGSAVTNKDGEARERWTLGPVAGDTQRVEARAVDAATGAALVFATFRAIGTAGAAASVAVVNDSTRTGAAGEVYGNPVAVVVRDAHGNPVPGATVTWTVLTGGGSVSAATSTTGATGVATVQWTLGPQIGTAQSIRASVTGATPATALATANRVAATATLTTEGSGQSAVAGTTLAAPVAVVLKLADGRPVQGATVTWAAAAGSITPATSQTDAAGRASAQWTLGSTAGTQGATATVAGLAPASFTATATSTGVVATVRLVSPPVTAPTGSTHTVTVQLLDVNENPVPGAPASWSIYSDPVIRTSNGLPVAGTEAWWVPYGNGSVSPASGVSDANGMVSTQLTLGTIIGVNGVQVSAPGASPAWSAYFTDFKGTGPLTMPLSCTMTPNTSSGATATQWTVSCGGGLAHTYALSSITIYVAGRSAPLPPSLTGGVVSMVGLDAGRFYPAKVVAVDVNGNQGATYTRAWFPP